MKVSLIKHTPLPEQAVAAAARLCYSPDRVEDLLVDMTPARAAKLIGKLVEQRHFSPFEHASFTFGVSGVSRSLSHQLVRHRIASYSQQSQRYVAMRAVPVVVPPSISQDAEALALFQQTMRQVEQAYQQLLRKVPAEDARYVLPNACATNLVVTMNARSLYNFFSLRCCNRAQWEIRGLAWAMLRLVREVAPNLFTGAGPGCLTAAGCQEGAMSCGQPPTDQSLLS